MQKKLEERRRAQREALAKLQQEQREAEISGLAREKSLPETPLALPVRTDPELQGQFPEKSSNPEKKKELGSLIILEIIVLSILKTSFSELRIFVSGTCLWKAASDPKQTKNPILFLCKFLQYFVFCQAGV